MEPPLRTPLTCNASYYGEREMGKMAGPDAEDINILFNTDLPAMVLQSDPHLGDQYCLV